MGTANYVAPEMITDNLASLATDLWAFGVILFKMAAGRIPFPGTSLPSVSTAIKNRDFTWPEDIDADCKDLIDKLLQVNPEDRLGYNGTDHDMKALLKHPFF